MRNMALMIPSTIDSWHDSIGEREVFEALRDKLPSDYTVFYSVRWNDRNEKSTIVWGESDFTIFHPDKGILVIEVKSGGIECRNGKWRYIRRDTGERPKMKMGPLEQACRSKYKFADLLEHAFDDYPESRRPYCWVEAAVWFPSIARGEVEGEMLVEYKPEIVLFQDALRDPKAFIDGVYDYYGTWHTKLDETAADRVVDILAPQFGALPSLRARRLEQREQFVRLTNAQLALLDYLDEQGTAAIQGSAGTGKTMLAVAKAKRLAKTGKVLFLCFNTQLKEYLQESKRQKPGEFKDIDFTNLYELTCDKLGSGVSDIKESDIIQFLKNYERYEWDYKHIVVDEGQDFLAGQIEVLKEISEYQEGALYVFYDKNQFVQGEVFRKAGGKNTETPEWLEKSECRLVLNTNCRNTFAIASTSGKPVKVKPKVKEGLLKGDQPKFYICENKRKAIKKLAAAISEYKLQGEYPYSQICVLSLKGEGMSILDGETSIGAHKITSTRCESGVFFTTARKFKGLESDVVFLIDFDEGTFDTDDDKMVFYVGASRARHALNIMFIGDESDLTTVAARLADRTPSNPAAAINIALAVKPIVR